MNDRNRARIRTALPQVWAALILFVFDTFGWLLTDATTTVLVALVPIVGAALYDLGRTLEKHNGSALARILSRVILGALGPPSYPSRS